MPKLPDDKAIRKGTPVYSGVVKYFPLALAAVARVSKAGNDQHNPGQPLHWARGKSDDHLDCIARHLTDCGQFDTDGELHDAHLAWRALANLELLEEGRLRPANTTVVQSNANAAAPGPKVSFMWGEPPVSGADVTNGCAMEPPPVLEPGWLIEGNKATDLKTGEVTLADPHRDGPFVSLAECSGARVGSDGQMWAPVKDEPKKFTFWYLATPYSKYPAGHAAAAVLSAMLAARVLEEGVPVFAPIAHSHPISKHTAASNTDHDFWIAADSPFIELASGLIVVTAEGWEESRGMAEEIQRFTASGKPIVYWAPWCRLPKTVRDTAVRRTEAGSRK